MMLPGARARHDALMHPDASEMHHGPHCQDLLAPRRAPNIVQEQACGRQAAAIPQGLVQQLAAIKISRVA